MTIPQAAEKVFDFTEEITESDTHSMELDLDGGRSVYFEASFEIEWTLVQTEPDEYDRTMCELSGVILNVTDDDGEVVEDLTAELQREFCKWFGKVEFETI